MNKGPPAGWTRTAWSQPGKAPRTTVRAAALTGNVLRVSLDPGALEDLRSTDGEIEAVIEAFAEDTALFREVLDQVLGYGRADAVPARVGI
ncbi:hypothetical protein [Streptomyces sp. NPDC000351]|uniref:hypothetical protein n=1 Tax=Streptomyces sp. NPDC000351 TaxID=3154250 RepID=UPI00331EAF98